MPLWTTTWFSLLVGVCFLDGSRNSVVIPNHGATKSTWTIGNSSGSKGVWVRRCSKSHEAFMRLEYVFSTIWLAESEFDTIPSFPRDFDRKYLDHFGFAHLTTRALLEHMGKMGRQRVAFRKRSVPRPSPYPRNGSQAHRDPPLP
ncbi:hypothetical protein SCHPADRAFT_897395 [Schizopora paradoxa]|uniref:Secreted protein n=1 Tax=Schizopora paradoxa TaxID=27342 RepID=A0A0H2QWP2_9AGAM|nr:hypothetical protein SCHPADRAFT_897395 [Schizopora paradoxa]